MGDQNQKQDRKTDTEKNPYTQTGNYSPLKKKSIITEPSTKPNPSREKSREKNRDI